ncbi:MAG: ubiquinol-cytochrome c reductase iron-sulfur subunit [Sciscionella sp.]
MSIDHPTRRSVLAAGAVGGVGMVGLLAGCGSQGTVEQPVSGTQLAKLNDIPVGSAKSVQGPDDKPVIVTRTADGTAVAFSAICTHQGCTVKPAGKELHCPCHGSKYDAATGKVLGGPAPEPLPEVTVHVAGGAVVTGKA